MIIRIRELKAAPNYCLSVLFDDGKRVLYDVAEDMRKIPSYGLLEDVPGLFQQARLDQSRTCVYWNEDIDLPSDWIYEHGAEIAPNTEGDDKNAVAEH